MKAVQPIKALVLLTLLAGCGNMPDSQELSGSVSALVAAVRGHRGAPAPNVPASDLKVAKWSKTPLLFVSLPKLRGYRSMFRDINVNADVVTWLSPEGADISLRNGVLIQTRGLTNDLMSSQAPTAREIGKGSGTTERKMAYLNGADQTFVVSYQCSLRTIGQATENFGPHKVQLKHVNEVCTGPLGSFTNQYWLDGTSRIWKSVQWVSEKTGYATMLVAGG